MTTRAPYGSWPSPLSAESSTAGTTPVGGGAFVDGGLWWLEGRPADGGRLTVMARGATTDEAPRELVAAPFNVRSRVNEYGGSSWLPVAPGGNRVLVFANFADQRVYLQDQAGGEPQPLTPESMAAGEPLLRFAEFIPGTHDGEVLAVCEDHRDALVRYIVAIPLDGSAAADPGHLRRVTPSSRFVAAPRLNHAGTRIAWISWEHPNMPWDGTELHVAELGADGVAREVSTVAGGPDESVLQPEWITGSELAFVSDRSGWWNLYAADLDTGAGIRALCPREEEFAGPLWQVGTTWFAVLDERTLLVTHGTHGSSLGRLDLATSTLTDLDLPFSRISPADVAGGLALVNATSLTEGDGLRVINLSTEAVENISLSESALPDPRALPDARPMEFVNSDGEPVYAHVYAPKLGQYAGLEGELPPYVALIHGGPTSQAFARLSPGIAYYTSRGIGVVDVNYGGSTGYGRAYRNRLRGQWGVVDVQDTLAVMTGLVDAGLADPHRLAIEGGSAGGWTVLAALTGSDVFAAGISRYGVSDLAALVQDTHDFESRYMESLVGPWPEARELYAQRAPINHLDSLNCPVLLLQGDEDKVVPPAQSQVVADALDAKGIPHAYVLFKGEQHGFRRRENIIRDRELSLAFYARVFGFEADVPPIELS
ncbi:S9 family peptidase [Paeniglutamicibacter cryotolerans]|uniref:Dipeptidyl aminopeptidase/acylaminoacyl peptidase n=1 Tax=Paeniglutamicibacter cryotolerans TaxID=670079 RepID=A0A839QFR1_9MICC|nr:prolyl oligopeptidase family serine peptidase [Paeniglutamicibacter cryotolerans]MBB2994463.1 dipeptidyl aminopeptidase/acylaminoacyl peptidase [Paeniglutamicibacter cryotolerans]